MDDLALKTACECRLIYMSNLICNHMSGHNTDYPDEKNDNDKKLVKQYLYILLSDQHLCM